jgi:hypothetical protein
MEIIGFPNYTISNDGVIMSRNKEMKHGMTKTGYHQIGLRNGKQQQRFYVHRLVYQHYGKDFDPTLTVDHINRNKDDNHIENLRMATHTEQKYNSIRQNKYGRGVCKQGNRYQALITINKKTNYLGSFKTIEEASNAYETKAQEIQGEFYRS